MAFVQANLVLETTSTTGTGTIDLNGAQNSAQTFVSGIGGGNTCDYVIRGQGDFEVGRGTVTAGSPDKLSRDTVYESSNSDFKVNFASGDKDVYITIPVDSNGRIPDADFGTLKEQGNRVGPVDSGTWTPIVEGGSTAGSFTYAGPTGGFYDRLGKTVSVYGYIDISSIDSSPSGDLLIKGLPFTIAAPSDNLTASFTLFGVTEHSNLRQWMVMSQGTNDFALRYIDQNGDQSIAQSDTVLTSSTKIVISCTYRVA